MFRDSVICIRTCPHITNLQIVCGKVIQEGRKQLEVCRATHNSLESSVQKGQLPPCVAATKKLPPTPGRSLRVAEMVAEKNPLFPASLWSNSFPLADRDL